MIAQNHKMVPSRGKIITQNCRVAPPIEILRSQNGKKIQNLTEKYLKFFRNK